MPTKMIGRAWLKDATALMQQALAACNPLRMEIVALVGAAGTGKTSLRWHLAEKLGRGAHFVAFDADHTWCMDEQVSPLLHHFKPNSSLPRLFVRLLGRVVEHPPIPVVVVLPSVESLSRVLAGVAAVPLPGQVGTEPANMEHLTIAAAHIVNLDTMTFETLERQWRVSGADASIAVQ
jgi:hypothetical protein